MRFYAADGREGEFHLLKVSLQHSRIELIPIEDADFRADLCDIFQNAVGLGLPHVEFVLGAAVGVEERDKGLDRKRVVLGGDTEVAAPARFTGVALFDKRHLVQNLARVAEEFLSRGGERETFPGAKKEGNAELLFKFAEGGSQRGLSHKQGFGGGGQRAALGNHIDIAELTQSRGENHPIVQDFLFVKQFEDENTIAKQTLPAPAQTLAELFREDNARITRAFYPDDEELLRDLAAAYRRVYLDLYAAGCRNIQLDDCTWGMIVDEEGYWKMREGDGATLEQEAERYLKVNNLSLENLPEDLVVNTHICRGNYHSTYASSGPYDKVAPYVFAQEKVESFYLEYDDKRSGNFTSLKQIPRGKKVVLGLITSKRPELESKELIKRRIYEASQYVPLRDLYLSPQCGFASCEIGNKLTEEEQFAKLRLVKEIAEEVWGKDKA